MHNGNDEVNESEPIVEEPKKEVNFYGFPPCNFVVQTSCFCRFLQDKVSDKIDEDSTLAPEIIAE